MKSNEQYHGSNITFIDMLFNILLVFALLLFWAITFMNVPAKKRDIEAKAELIVTMNWPDNSPHDIDMWIKVPEGMHIGYNHKENTYLFLERDDLGANNNFTIKDGEKVVLPFRREVATFRGTPPGRYVVNSQFYLAKKMDGSPLSAEYEGPPIPVELELIQLNPVYKILAKKTIHLSHQKDEKTAFSFIVRGDLVIDIALDIEEPFILQAPMVSGNVP
jgi:hypothetical protein